MNGFQIIMPKPAPPPVVNILLSDDEDEPSLDEDTSNRPLIVTADSNDQYDDDDDIIGGGDSLDEMSKSKTGSRLKTPSLSVGKIKIFKPNRKRRLVMTTSFTFVWNIIKLLI